MKEIFLKNRTRILFFSIIVAGLMIIANDVIREYLKSGNFKFDYFSILSVGFLAYAILMWRDKFFYGITIIYFLIELFPPSLRAFRLLSLSEITTLSMAQFGLVLNMLLVLLSIIIVASATSILSLHLRQEKRLRKLSAPALIKDYFESALLLDEYKGDIDREDEARTNALWDLYELERRDKHLLDLVKAFASKDRSVREKAGDEILERFGKEPLRPLQDSKENEYEEKG